MKHVVLFLLTLYQAVVSPLLKQLLGISSSCRFSPTCSRYTQEMIKQHGVITGSRLGLKQLFACHPFSSYEYL
jgi:putative membrane protein insertion efficiency factor